MIVMDCNPSQRVRTHEFILIIMNKEISGGETKLFHVVKCPPMNIEDVRESETH